MLKKQEITFANCYNAVIPNFDFYCNCYFLIITSGNNILNSIQYED